jgi:hypothetical protein
MLGAAGPGARGVSALSAFLEALVDPTRRAVVAATATLPLLIAGCRGAQALGPPPRPAADETRLRAAIEAEDLMVARYQAVLGRSGAGLTSSQQAVVAAVLAEHQAHQRQLRARLAVGSPTAAGSGPLPRPAVTRPAGSPLVYLSQAERAASDWLLRQVTEVPPSLAQLLASISASEATHGPALRRAA